MESVLNVLLTTNDSVHPGVVAARLYVMAIDPRGACTVEVFDA